MGEIENYKLRQLNNLYPKMSSRCLRLKTYLHIRSNKTIGVPCSLRHNSAALALLVPSPRTIIFLENVILKEPKVDHLVRFCRFQY